MGKRNRPNASTNCHEGERKEERGNEVGLLPCRVNKNANTQSTKKRNTDKGEKTEIIQSSSDCILHNVLSRHITDSGNNSSSPSTWPLRSFYSRIRKRA